MDKFTPLPDSDQKRLCPLVYSCLCQVAELTTGKMKGWNQYKVTAKLAQRTSLSDLKIESHEKLAHFLLKNLLSLQYTYNFCL
jgi:hypothetical protein